MNIAKQTAKRMLQNIDQELQALAQQQQQMNGNVGGQPGQGLMCHGGKIRRRHMPDGGFNKRPYNPSNTGFGYDINQPYQVNWNLPQFDTGNPDWYKPFNRNSFAGNDQKKVALPTDGYNYDNHGSMNQHLSDITNKFNLAPSIESTISKSNTLAPNKLTPPRPGNSGSAMDWMGMLPGLFNLGAGLMSPKAQHLNPNRFQNQYANQALSMMPDQYRIDPQLNQAKNAYANYTRNVNNAANSRGEMMANYGSGMNQYNATVAGAYADKNNQENEMRLRKAGMMNEIGQQRAGVNLNVQNMNDQNSAAALDRRMGYLGAGVSDLQKNYLINKQMANQQEAQKAWLWAIANQPHYKDWVLGGVDPDFYGTGKQ